MAPGGLAANTTACTLAYWHHPHFAHGHFSNNSAYQPFWQLLYDDRAEIVRVGHDHNYQRYAHRPPRAVWITSKGFGSSSSGRAEEPSAPGLHRHKPGGREREHPRCPEADTASHRLRLAVHSGGREDVHRLGHQFLPLRALRPGLRMEQEVIRFRDCPRGRDFSVPP
jgi:hypothetical protein